MSSTLAAVLATIPPATHGDYVRPYRTRGAAWYRLKRLDYQAGIAAHGLPAYATCWPTTTTRAKMGHVACSRLSCITGPLSGGIKASTRPVIRSLHGEPRR